jgi:hypothetical protein
MIIEKVNIDLLKENPDNPRTIKGDKFKKLVKSIKDFPEMLEARPIVVDDDMIVLGGNMRLKACKDAGLKEVHIIRFVNLSDDKKREFIVKDNVGYGEWDWDILNVEWDVDLLQEWGLDVVSMIDSSKEEDVIHFEKSLQVLPKNEYIIIYAPESSIEWDELKSIFKCKIVRQGGCRIGSTSDEVGTGLERVFDLKTFKERLDLKNNNYNEF